MDVKFTSPHQVEGRWEDLLSQSSSFAGKRVRVTVLPDEGVAIPTLGEEIRRWLEEGDRLETSQPSHPADGFTDGLVEKFRKQGLVL